MTSKIDSLQIRAVAQTKHSNKNGTIFGGWLLSQMDLAAYGCIRKEALGSIVTVGATDIRFIQPLYINDIISIYGNIIRKGTTSITCKIEVYSNSDKIAEGVFTFVDKGVQK